MNYLFECPVLFGWMNKLIFIPILDDVNITKILLSQRARSLVVTRAPVAP
jgi:hypothetical protein